jgi:hypothetical protein
MSDHLMSEDPLWVWDADTEGNKLFIVANGYESPQPTCPVFGDILKFKDVTIVVPSAVLSDAVSSLEYNHGGDCVTRQKLLPNGMVAMRSEAR